MRLGVDIDQHLGSGAQELPPDFAALLSHVLLGQLLHPPDGLDEEQILGGVLLFQEGSEVIMPDRILEHVPAAERPPFDPPLRDLKQNFQHEMQ